MLGLVVSGAARADAETPFVRPSITIGAGRVVPTRAIDSAGMTWGAGAGIDYEGAHARIGGTYFLGGGGSWSSSALRVAADWLPLSGSWTPYLGAGGGFALIGKKRPYQSGEVILPPYLALLPMLSVEGGIELFRNRPTRLLLGADLELPWSRPYECNADYTSCGDVWQLRYPVIALYARVILPG